MDSVSNLSLLEIAGEDDSLLSDVPTTANLFSCSPLLSLRSLAPKTEGRGSGAVDSENPISSPKDGANKENTPKLSLEPQQMKRKKKGGGYNLRKSLAWDRAFFTEQGVLNPLELSMISGTATSNAELNLEVIHEEEPATTSLALQEIEENLFKRSSEGVPIAGLSPKPGASTKHTLPSASLAKRKVLAVNDVVANRSKRSACPRPVPSSSLKRPDTVKGLSKESKVSRIPGLKSDVSASATTARSGTLGTVSSKRNQNAHPATNVQKYAGIKGLPKNPKTVPSNPRVDLADKFSVTRTLSKQAGKHLNNSVSETHPPARMHQPGSEANKVSEACLPRGVSDTGEKKEQTLFQTTKSSGLRMPSPSLGFFSQAKTSGSRSQLQKSSKPCTPAESNIPKSRKLETISANEARLPHAPRKRSEIVEGAAKNCSKEISLSDVKSEPSMQIDNKQMAGVEVECGSLGFEKISKQAKAENILEHVTLKSKEHGEPRKSENVSSMEDVVFPRHENKLLSESCTYEQLEKVADCPVDDKLYDVLSNGDQSLFQEPQSMHYQSVRRTSNNTLNTMHNATGQEEQIKLPACDVLTSNGSLVLQAENGAYFNDSKHSGELKEHESVKTAPLNSSLSDFSETVFGGSIQGIPCKSTEQVNGGADDFGKCGGDAHVLLLNGSLSVNCNETTQSNLEGVNQQLLGEQLKTPNPSIVGEINSKEENEPHVNSCWLAHETTLSSKGSPVKSSLEINGASESESKIIEIEDCQLPADGQSGFTRRRPVDEEYDQLIDSKATRDRSQAFEPDGLSEDCRTVSATACSTTVTDVSPERRPLEENNVENLNFTSQPCPTVKADCDSGGNDVSVDNCCTNSESQLRDDSSYRDTSMHCDVEHDVPGNFEQQASMFTYPEINEILYEDQSLAPNHGHLLQSEFSEVSADFISKDSLGSGTDNPSGLLEHALLARSVQEIDDTNREIEESHVEDAQVQSFNEIPVAYDCNNKNSLAVTNDQLSLADDNNVNEDSHLSEFQKPSAVDGVDSQNVNNTLHLEGDWLPTNIASSEEIKKKEVFEGAFEGCNIPTSEHNASNHHIQVMPENKDGNSDADERAELLQMDDAEKGSSDILPLVQVQLNDNIVSAEFDSSKEVSEDPLTKTVAWKSEEQCSLTENSKLLASDNLTFNARISQGSEVSSLNSKNISYEAETSIFEKDEFPTTDMQHQTKGDITDINSAEDSNEIIHFKESTTKSKQEVSPVNPPPNAAPFSDEWLAAIEAAGEEILTMKSGAVQNSPPDKPQHEPGPWSPVRRKNQGIGPFDCTKHGTQHSGS